MAQLINFPDRGEREEREAIDAGCALLTKAGVAPTVAKQTILEAMQDLHEFRQELKLAAESFHVESEAAQILLSEVMPRIANIVDRAFVRQRNASALRRLGFKHRD